MRKRTMILLAGALLSLMSSCANMLENMDVNCDEERLQSDKCENCD